MSWAPFVALALAPFAFLGARELMKASKTGVFDHGGDWDIRLSDEPAFFSLHFILLIAPIFGFLVSLVSALSELFG